MLDLNKHIVKADDSKPFHTSGYAVAANGNSIGSVSTVSFEKRLQIDQNRQKIGNYSRSAIANNYQLARPRQVIASSRNNLSVGPRVVQKLNNAPTAKPQSYNPYS
jgi:hypothetical protein